MSHPFTKALNDLNDPKGLRDLRGLKKRKWGSRRDGRPILKVTDVLASAGRRQS
jgi:hypothetical protein